jgi:hypothetical protein
MKRLLITLCGGAWLAIAMAGVSLGDSGSISDPKNDVQHNPGGGDANYDIVKATFGHAKHGLLSHKVTVAGHIGNPTASGPTDSQPAMWIDVPHHEFTGNCDYLIQPVPPGAPGNSSNHTKYLASKCSTGQTTGTARATRTKKDTDKLTFKPSAIGSPGKYGWAFVFITDTDQGLALADRAPDKGFKVHHLN